MAVSVISSPAQIRPTSSPLKKDPSIQDLPTKLEAQNQATAEEKSREIKKAKGEEDKMMEKTALRFPLLLSLFLVFLSFPHLSSSVATIPISLDEPSAYKELKSWGFPIGLLPANVKDYSLNRTTGDFSVSLGEQCQITLPPDNYVATYKRTLTGRLAEGKIGQLDGIQVWAIFKWWSITGIRTSGENLVFEVGMVSAKFPTKSFDESPLCEGTSSASR